LFVANNIFAQNRILRGQVVNENFEPISNAVIKFGDSLHTVECDNFGHFELNIDKIDKEIEVIHIGYKTEKVFVEKKCYINVVMINYNNVEFATVKEEKRFYKRQKRRVHSGYINAIESGRLKRDENCNEL
jgi:hypothetical protein